MIRGVPVRIAFQRHGYYTINIVAVRRSARHRLRPVPTGLSEIRRSLGDVCERPSAYASGCRPVFQTKTPQCLCPAYLRPTEAEDVQIIRISCREIVPVELYRRLSDYPMPHPVSASDDLGGESVSGRTGASGHFVALSRALGFRLRKRRLPDLMGIKARSGVRR